MNVLLDECLDRRYARELPGHYVRTVPQMGWPGIHNGQLIALAEQQFDVFITVDRNLSFQQDLPQFAIAVLVLHASTNRFVDLKPLAPDILAALPSAVQGQMIPFTPERSPELQHIS